MPANAWEYEKVVGEGDLAGLKIILTEDTSYLHDELENSRKLSIPVRPSYNAFAVRVLAKLASRIPDMKQPLESSRIVVESYSADGEVYFHYSLTGKWNDRIVSYDPANK